MPRPTREAIEAQREEIREWRRKHEEEMERLNQIIRQRKRERDYLRSLLGA
jgi:hypothetical protein